MPCLSTTTACAAWPGAHDFLAIEAPHHIESFDVAVAALAAINKSKADAEVSMGRDVESLVLSASPATLESLARVAPDVLAAARVKSHDFAPTKDSPDGEFRITEITFADRPPKA